MNQTRQEYITEQQKELAAEGWELEEIKYLNLDNEYYSLLEEHIKQGNTITQEIFNSLTPGQQFHFAKHYNQRADKISNSDYQKEIEEGKKQVEKNFEKYLSEQAKKQQEQDLKDQKAKQITINQLNQEIEQLQNNLYDYNKLSPIGQRNISKQEHNNKQNKIKVRIAELEEKIKIIV